MERKRRAAIDVGTNSVKLLVVEVEDGTVKPVFETAEQTRLGRGMFQTKLMAPEAIAHTARAVAEFGAMARQHHASSIRVIATSAARNARNKAELLRAIQVASGLSAEVITGEQEAEYVFCGVSSDPCLTGHRLLIVEVGGGSTELIIGHGRHHSFRQALPLGGVSLLDQFSPADPPARDELASCQKWVGDFLKGHVSANLRGALQHPERSDLLLVGTGGTASILGRMELRSNEFNRAAIEGVCLTRAAVSQWVTRLWSVPLEERKKWAGLPPNRADVILMGTLIFEAIMNHFSLETLQISTRGLRFGIVLDKTKALRL